MSADSIDFLLTDISDEAKLYSETDSYYLYEDLTDPHDYILYLLPKEASFYYTIRVSRKTFDDFTVSDYNTVGYSEPGASYKKGEFFTEETYKAFKDTITYLGK